jgi:hypothetical protein
MTLEAIAPISDDPSSSCQPWRPGAPCPTEHRRQSSPAHHPPGHDHWLREQLPGKDCNQELDDLPRFRRAARVKFCLSVLHAGYRSWWYLPCLAAGAARDLAPFLQVTIVLNLQQVFLCVFHAVFEPAPVPRRNALSPPTDGSLTQVLGTGQARRPIEIRGECRIYRPTTS